MVDPISLSLGGAVAVLVAKAAEKAGEGLTAAGTEVLVRLRNRLRDRLAGNAQVLAELEEVPDSPRRAQSLATIVDRIAAEDPTFGAEIAALVRSAEDAGVEVQTISQSIQGQGNVQAAGVEGSSITVSYGQPPPPPSPPPLSPPDDRS